MSEIQAVKPVAEDINHKIRKLDSVQCCRAIAFLMVLMLHRTPSWDLMYIFQYGRYGVMMFFIISGFIITYLHLNGRVEVFNKFILKRVFRIYPVYLFSAFLSAAIIFCIYISEYSGWKPFPEVSYIGWVVSSTLLPVVDKYLINLVAWSLVFEMWYYIFFGLLMAVLKDKFIIGVSFYSFMIIIVQVFLPEIVSNREYFINFNVLFSSLNWLFVIGSCIAYLMFDNECRYKYLCILTLLACYVSQITMGYHATLEEISSRYAEFILLTVSIVVVVGMIWLEVKAQIKPPKFLVGLGDMSYTLYLFHYIWVFLFGVIFSKVAPGQYHGGIVEVVLFYITLICICRFIYLTFEIPSNKYLRTRFLKGFVRQ